MTDVTFSGPLFNGRAEAAASRAAVEIRHTVADEGKKLTEVMFAGSIRENRGEFMRDFQVIDDTHIYTSHSGHHTYTMPIVVGSNETVVTSDQATYGPWLEGTGSRNSTTRFKGYNGFRRAAQGLNTVAKDIADGVLDHYVRDMQ